MQAFQQKVTLGLNHVQVLVRGMYAVAQCDGVHATEQVLLREFYEGCRSEVDGLASFNEVISVPLDQESARDVLDTPELRELFLRSCLLLAFADGDFSVNERSLIERLATLLAVTPERLTALEDEARSVLVRRIAHIHNVDALQRVVKALA
jgi:tellurite resistance protein